jgi:hypothetical protein
MQIIALFACLSVLLAVSYFVYCIGVTVWLDLRERIVR